MLIQSQKLVMTLRLKKFDVAAMQPSSVIFLIGSQHVGKTFMIKHILRRTQDLSSGTIICGTPYTFYTDVPNATVYETFDTKILANIVQDQRKTRSKSFVVLDDCIYDQSWHNIPSIRNLVMHSRTLNTMFFFTQIWAYGIPPTLSASIDYVFLFRSPILANRRRIFEQYGSLFPDFDTFMQIMNVCTDKEYDCLVLDFTSRSSAIEDRVFWYRAPAI
jgi:hypothetical protein